MTQLNFIPSNTDKLFVNSFITSMYETNNLSFIVDNRFNNKFLQAKEETNKQLFHIFDRYKMQDILSEEDNFLNFFKTLKIFHTHNIEYIKLYNNNFKISIVLDKNVYYYMSQIIPEDLNTYTRTFIQTFTK